MMIKNQARKIHSALGLGLCRDSPIGPESLSPIYIVYALTILYQCIVLQIQYN